MNVQENSVPKLESVENDVLEPSPPIEIIYVNKVYIQTDSIQIPRETENEIVEKAVLYKSRDIPNYAELAIEHWMKDKTGIKGNGSIYNIYIIYILIGQIIIIGYASV